MPPCVSVWPSFGRIRASPPLSLLGERGSCCLRHRPTMLRVRRSTTIMQTRICVYDQVEALKVTDSDEIIDVPTIAHEFSLSERQVRLQLRLRDIPHFTLPGRGRRLFVRRADLAPLHAPSSSGSTPRMPSIPGRRSKPRLNTEDSTQEILRGTITRRSMASKTRSSQVMRLLQQLLREARLNARMSQPDVADLLDRDRTFVADYELGRRRLDVIELREICAALGVPFLEFVAMLDREITAAEGERQISSD